VLANIMTAADFATAFASAFASAISGYATQAWVTALGYATQAWVAAGDGFGLYSNGYIVLPSWLWGVTLQWGTVYAESNPQTFSFNIAFANTCFNGVATSSGSYNRVGFDPISSSQYELWIPGAGNYRWFAIGY
jgi:hypothetical protein